MNIHLHFIHFPFINNKKVGTSKLSLVRFVVNKLDLLRYLALLQWRLLIEISNWTANGHRRDNISWAATRATWPHQTINECRNQLPRFTLKVTSNQPKVTILKCQFIKCQACVFHEIHASINCEFLLRVVGSNSPWCQSLRMYLIRWWK